MKAKLATEIPPAISRAAMFAWEDSAGIDGDSVV
jgi:hypothetical protein